MKEIHPMGVYTLEDYSSALKLGAAQSAYLLTFRQEKAVRMLLNGHRHMEISVDLGVSLPRVKWELATVREDSLGSSLRELEDLKAEQFAKIDIIQSEAL